MKNNKICIKIDDVIMQDIVSIKTTSSQKSTLIIARLASFLAVLFTNINFYLIMTLIQFYPVPEGAAPGSVLIIIGSFSLLGSILSCFLCPFFFKTPVKSTVFVLLAVFPNVIVRIAGGELWSNSLYAWGLVQIFSGMLYPISIGLFLQTHLFRQDSTSLNMSGCENRTGKYCTFLFALVLAIGSLSRHIYFTFLKDSGLISDISNVLALSFSIDRWVLAFIGVSLIICITMLFRLSASPLWDRNPQGGNLISLEKTNWSMIGRLIGLVFVHRTLNAIMEMRLLPRFFYPTDTFDLLPIVQVIILPLIALLAYRSINRFLRFFILASIPLFIMVSCLILFEDYPHVVLFMDILLGTFNNLIWAIFTIALIEHYAGGFWFFSLASIIYFVLVLLSPFSLIIRFIPEGIEFTVLTIAIISIIFIFLALRIVFPKNQSDLNPAPVSNIERRYKNLDEICEQRNLSKREIEVVNLMLNEGLGAEEIASRLFVSTTTIKSHFANVYRKFDVNKRSEFMALFVRHLAKET